MLCDAREHLAEIEFGVDSVELCASHERVDGSCAKASGVSTCKQVITPAESNGTQSALGAGVVDFDQSVIDVASKRPPSRERIAYRHRSIGLCGEGCELLLKPSMEVIEQRSGSCLPYFSSLFNGLTADLPLDSVQRADAIERFGGDRRRLHLVDVVELAPGMSHARGFV